jgi:hypothetical protein
MRGHTTRMYLGVSLIVIAIGAILTWAVNPTHPGSVNVHVVGVIVMVVGLIGFLLDLMLWSDWGPAYVRRRREVIVDDGYPAAPRWPYRRRRTVVERDPPL